MKVYQIYKDNMISRNLQEHMLRVAALAQIVLNDWIGEQVDKKAIVQVCLLHDIAKPMNFDLVKQAHFGMSQEEISNLKKLQPILKLKYGINEHKATVEMCRELGCVESALRILNNLEWIFLDRLIKDNDIESLITIYCDMRMGPFGILPVEERFKDLINRRTLEGFNEIQKNGIVLEKLIKEKVTISLTSITDDQLNSKFEELLNIVVSK